MIRRPPRSTLFPSPPLFRSRPVGRAERVVHVEVTQGGERLGECGVVRLFPWPEPRVFHQRHTAARSEEHTSELQSQSNLVCRLLLEKKNMSKRPQTRVCVML